MFAPAPSTRRRHRGRRLLVALVVLVGLLVVVDRVALIVAEKVTATTIRNAQHLDSTPSVSVSGFPFLTQLAAGHFDQVTIKARDVPTGTGSRALTVAAVTVVLHGVHVARDLHTVRADTADAAGTVTYADLSRALGLTITYAGTSGGAGRVQARGSTTVLGQSISATVSSGLAVSGGALQFVDPSVAGVDLPAAAVTVLDRIFGAALPLTDLPFGVTVTGVHATAAGVTVDLTGAQLVYTRS